MEADKDISLRETSLKPEFERRLASMRANMRSAKQDAALLFSLHNLRYLFNYSGEAAYGIATQDELVIITDYRFSEQAQEEAQQANIAAKVVCRDRDRQSLGQAIHVELMRRGVQNCWYEAEHVSVGIWNAIVQENLGVTFMPSLGVLEQQRKIKDAWEVAQMQAAAKIGDQALAMLIPKIKLGVSEREIALELDYQMQKLGSEGLSFVTILGFGARSALPHCIPSERRLREGDLLVLDFGAVVNGYRSDMTRSFVAGRADSKQAAMYDTVLTAQYAAMSVLKNGLPAQAANTAALTILKASPFAQYAGLGLGHGVGLQLHEQPFINAVCTDTLRSQYVVTIEPGIYIPGYGGVRIEDDVLITDDAFVRLTQAPKNFELAI